MKAQQIRRSSIIARKKPGGFSIRSAGLMCLAMEDPPVVTNTVERMNSLISGTRNPTMDELVAISEVYDVSINYLVTGDEWFPSLRQLKKRDAEKILAEIEMLKPEIEF